MFTESELNATTVAKIKIHGSNDVHHLLIIWDENIQVFLIHKENFWKGTFGPDKIEHFCSYLNMSIEQYKDNMKLALSSDYGSDDFVYDLTSNHFSWKKVINKSVILKYGTVEFNEVSSCGGTDLLVDTVIEINKLLEKKLQHRDQETSQLAEDLKGVIAKFKCLSEDKCAMEAEIYAKFMSLLNAKKQRISNVEEFINDIGYGQSSKYKKPSAGADYNLSQKDTVSEPGDPQKEG